MIEIDDKMLNRALTKHKLRSTPAEVKPNVEQKRLDKFEKSIESVVERSNTKIDNALKKFDTRVESYKTKIAKLEVKINLLEKELKKRRIYEGKLLKILEKPDRFVQGLQEGEERLLELGGRLQSYLVRESVLTEVSRYVRRLGSADLIATFHLKLMQAYNWGDEFWEQHGSASYTILEWFDKIMDIEDITDNAKAETAMAKAMSGSIA
jgi:hypothetical protein